MTTADRTTPSGPILLTRSDGPDTPESSTPRTGLFDAPVADYELRGHGSLSLDALLPGGAVLGVGEVLKVAVYPVLLADDAGVPDRASTLLGLVADGLPAMVGVHDQDGHDLTAAPAPRPAHLGRTSLVPDQWNFWRIDEPALAGSPASALRLLSRADHGHGWIQARTAPRPRLPVLDGEGADDPVAVVDTRRGTDSGPGFSRGNTFPAVCVPHGMNFLTPVTDARSSMWLYRWHGDPHPRLAGVAVSHQPSPWIGDRGSVSVMPFLGAPDDDPARRAVRFRHDDEIARPDTWAATLENGIRLSVVSTERAGVINVHLPADGGLTLDQPADGALSVTLDGDLAEVTGWASGDTVTRSEPSVPRCFIVARVAGVTEWERAHEAGGADRDVPATGGADRPQSVHLRLPSGDHELRLATSFVSVCQARLNLEREAGSRPAAELRREAHDAWAAHLGRLDLHGARPAQRAAAMSALYRLHCYPNTAHEVTAEGRTVHAAVALPLERPHTAAETGCRVVAGELHVNNGYWDTYRTCWPVLHLLEPELAASLLDGLHSLYRDSGWMGRWSAPGFVDCMVGTSSDVILADADAHGLALDQDTAWAASLRNALTPGPSTAVGRRGQGRARFRDWVPAEVPEGLSWTIEGGINDAGLARWARRRAERAAAAGDVGGRRRLLAHAEYLDNRARTWRRLVPADSHFPVGRREDGAWETEPGSLDPAVWGGSYTETNAWGMSVSAVHDVDWLTASHGGPAGLGEHLDRYLSEPERASEELRGTYPVVIHEMVEARAIGMGQLGLSNQPAHHVPWLYLASDRPDRAAEVISEALDRLFTGVEIGQGWPGDEDNGEFSAWWLLATLGLYAVDLASGTMALTPPQVPEAAWTRVDGTRLVVRTTGTGRYLAGGTVNAVEMDAPFVDVATLHESCEIVLRLAEEPTGWGAASLPSGTSARPYRSDAASRGRLVGSAEAAPLLDDLGESVVRLDAGAVVEVDLTALDLTGDVAPRITTVTCDRPGDGFRIRVALRVDGVWGEAEEHHLAPRWESETIVLPLPGLDAGQGAEGVEAVRWELPDGGDLRQLELI